MHWVLGIKSEYGSIHTKNCVLKKLIQKSQSVLAKHANCSLWSIICFSKKILHGWLNRSSILHILNLILQISQTLTYDPWPPLPAITLSSMGLARPLLQRLKKSTISIRYHISYWTLLQTRPEVFLACYNNHRHIETHCCAGFVRVLVTWLKWFLTYIWQPWFCTTFCKASATIGTHLWMKAKWVWSKRQVMV